MKLDRILIILIFNAIFWSLINSGKNNKNKNKLIRVRETSKDNDGAESSVNPQIQMLKPTPKITKKDTTINIEKGKKVDRSEYMRTYWKKNKEKKREYNQIYRQNNKEKRKEYDRIHYQDNKEKKLKCCQKYQENNREKLRESARKYRENNKEKKQECNRKYYQNNKEKLNGKKRESRRKCREERKKGKLNPDHADNNEVTPIVYEKGIQSEGGSRFNQGEDEAETYANEQNQNVAEDPNKIPENCMNQINLNEYPFDLNEKPEDNDEDVC
ncbi:unnamed protein product [Meloidogyne enterolobii]|uniref:Uncharacterized protein n=1 Tax=Meloidogyne enterolobii TaxID=390850 RepID=A0ACB0Z4F8_MELEN